MPKQKFNIRQRRCAKQFAKIVDAHAEEIQDILPRDCRRGQQRQDHEATMVADIIANARHYCTVRGIDWYEVDRRAYEHVLAEAQQPLRGEYRTRDGKIIEVIK